MPSVVPGSLCRRVSPAWLFRCAPPALPHLACEERAWKTGRRGRRFSRGASTHGFLALARHLGELRAERAVPRSRGSDTHLTSLAPPALRGDQSRRGLGLLATAALVHLGLRALALATALQP